MRILIIILILIALFNNSCIKKNKKEVLGPREKKKEELNTQNDTFLFSKNDSSLNIKECKPCSEIELFLDSTNKIHEVFASYEKENCLVLDTNILSDLNLTILESSILNSFVIDTFRTIDNKIFYIRKFKDTKFYFFLNKKVHKIPIILSKYLSLDSIYKNKNILAKSIFNTPYLDSVDIKNRELYINIFFGFPESDNGELLRYKISEGKGLEFLSIVKQNDYDY